MNCKPGDFAEVIFPGVNYGKKVFVLRRLSNIEVQAFGFIQSCSVSWLVESAGAPLRGGVTGRRFTQRPFADTSLRPINDPGLETPEQSTEAMRRLHDTTVPAKKKEPVVRPYEWEEL